MLQHQQQYYDYNQSSPTNFTNSDSLNTTPFSVKDILNLVNQNENYEVFGSMERLVEFLLLLKILQRLHFFIFRYTYLFLINR